MVRISTLNNSAIFFCESQKVSSSKKTSMVAFPSGTLYNSISNFSIVI